MVPVAFKEAGRDRHVQRLGQLLHRGHAGVFVHRAGKGKQRLILDRAEIGRGKSSGGRIICAPLAAASSTSATVAAMFCLILAAQRQLQRRR
jgi:hypothetical protein